MQESPFFDIPFGEQIASNDSAFVLWDGFAVSPSELQRERTLGEIKRITIYGDKTGKYQ
jgi:hypothetical protein